MTSGARESKKKQKLTHIARSSGSVLGIFRPPDASDSEVSNSKVAILIDHDILGLDIPVEDVLVVDILKAADHASDEKP